MKMVNPKETMEKILSLLEKPFVVASGSLNSLDLPFELEPEDLIKFAEEDMKESNEKSLINALSNIKRAIDCRIDCLLYVFGMYEKTKKDY